MTYKDKKKMNPVKRKIKDYYKWRYSGMITVPIVVIGIFLALYYQTESLPFFNSWSCDTLIKYKTDENLPYDIIPYYDLTDDLKLVYDNMVKTCMFKP